MMPQSIDRKLRLFFYLILFLLLSTQITKNKNIKSNITTKLNNIEVIGLSDENNLKVYESLKFLLTENILFINKKDFQNILTKIIGSNNPLNVARAVMNALESLQDAVKIATKRGITVKEVFS